MITAFKTSASLYRFSKALLGHRWAELCAFSSNFPDHGPTLDRSDRHHDHDQLSLTIVHLLVKWTRPWKEQFEQISTSLTNCIPRPQHLQIALGHNLFQAQTTSDEDSFLCGTYYKHNRREHCYRHGIKKTLDSTIVYVWAIIHSQEALVFGILSLGFSITCACAAPQPLTSSFLTTIVPVLYGHDNTSHQPFIA